MRTVYRNANILTMDDRNPKATSLLCADDLILRCGGPELADSAERQVDLHGGTVLPGFVDAHSHLSTALLYPDLTPPPEGESLSALLERVEQLLRDNPGDGWLVARGYELTGGGHPSRTELDRLCPDRPLLLLHRSMHLGTLNTAGLRECGYTKGVSDPEGGVIRRGEDGEPNGVVEENALFCKTLQSAMTPSPESLAEAVAQASRWYASFGITLAQDGALTPEMVPMYRALGRMGKLKTDVGIYLLADGAELPDMGSEPGWRDGVRVCGVKTVLDGSPQMGTAWLTVPYACPPEGKETDWKGYPAQQADTVRALCAHCQEAGLQLLAHCNGDAAMDQFLMAWEQARLATRVQNVPSPVIIHAQTIRDDQLDRCARLGVIPSFFHDHVYYYGQTHRRMLGDARAARISPLRAAQKRGICFTLHQDTPVVPPDMLRTLEIAVTRRDASGTVLGAGQALTVPEALRALTRHAAAQYGESETRGILAPGARADFTVLDRSPLDVPKAQLHQLRILRTVRGGIVTYQRPEPHARGFRDN